MTKVNSILDQRMKKASHSPKMAAMAEQSARGNLTTFSGMFSITELGVKEKQTLEDLLHHYSFDTTKQELQNDLSHLISITAEVKAINNQAAFLHGERIKKAHTLLTKYRDGAFTTWLIATYGNRQTPYNLMQYFEFCEALPKELRPQIELMPKQAVYTLASTPGHLEKKKEIVERYNGETKQEMLLLIRKIFPLSAKDKRRKDFGNELIHQLKKILNEIEHVSSFSPEQQKEIKQLLKQIQHKTESL